MLDRGDFEVRDATEADLTKLEACYLRSWRAAYEGFREPHWLAREVQRRRSFDWSLGMQATTAVVSVAVDSDNRVLGVVQADENLPPPRDLPEITMLHADPPFWDSPVASALLHSGEAWMASRNHGSARLRVVEAHLRARRFFEREGWRLDPAVEPARNDFFDLIYYRRSLIVSPRTGEDSNAG